MEPPKKLTVIHLDGLAPGDEETVADYLLIRTPVTIGDEIYGVKRFQNGICKVTGIRDGVIFATGTSPSGETATCPIGENIEWKIVRKFPVLCNGFMRSQECDQKTDSKALKVSMARILRASRWAKIIDSPFWKPTDGDNKLK